MSNIKNTTVQQLDPQYWDGNGVPPVGTICEAYHDNLEYWYKVKVLDRVGEHFACSNMVSGFNKRLLFWAHIVRPIKTKEEN